MGSQGRFREPPVAGVRLFHGQRETALPQPAALSGHRILHGPMLAKSDHRQARSEEGESCQRFSRHRLVHEDTDCRHSRGALPRSVSLQAGHHVSADMDVPRLLQAKEAGGNRRRKRHGQVRAELILHRCEHQLRAAVLRALLHAHGDVDRIHQRLGGRRIVADRARRVGHHCVHLQLDAAVQPREVLWNAASGGPFRGADLGPDQRPVGFLGAVRLRRHVHFHPPGCCAG
mmetsp:Transcript_26979/g.62762  ORF Transcript_26979/g.62762 Transcript_26979/m.62762 type:complete len:231 (-) Transcript_26979:525-1217(-)